MHFIQGSLAKEENRHCPRKSAALRGQGKGADGVISAIRRLPLSAWGRDAGRHPARFYLGFGRAALF
ncbi:MAG TPA: hypothetical protein H9674_06500 [Firmicutes bacterium]|nr:hypothetical protein [Bacillota bacterium]